MQALLSALDSHCSFYSHQSPVLQAQRGAGIRPRACSKYGWVSVGSHGYMGLQGFKALGYHKQAPFF